MALARRFGTGIQVGDAKQLLTRGYVAAQCGVQQMAAGCGSACNFAAPSEPGLCI